MTAKNIKPFTEKFRRRQYLDIDSIIYDCKRLFEQLLNESNNYNQTFKKSIPEKVIWILSGINGKYNVRYQSGDAKREIENKTDVNLIVEHVEPRSFILRKIDDGECDFDELLCHLNTCLVTRYEHNKLHATVHKNGWPRYKEADIKVYDCYKNEWLDF